MIGMRNNLLPFSLFGKFSIQKLIRTAKKTTLYEQMIYMSTINKLNKIKYTHSMALIILWIQYTDWRLSSNNGFCKCVRRIRKARKKIRQNKQSIESLKSIFSRLLSLTFHEYVKLYMLWLVLYVSYVNDHYGAGKD